MMVGHPGETDADFDELLDFLRFARFERMGAFMYSHEEGTYAYKHYHDDVPTELKQQRMDELMLAQQHISAAVNQQKIGSEMKVIIDRKERDYFIGRTEFDSPEVDPEVLIPAHTKGVAVGEFSRVLIDDAGDFDLYASVVKP
jgi:ribosomal protein S12 methylthiotransferase